jgi:negative regulator of sigma E activity
MKQLSDLTVIAQEIHPDEACYGLAEMTLVGRDGKGLSRYQLTMVIRSDSIVPHVRALAGVDLKVPPLRIVSYGDDTVGELWDMANEFRRNHWLEEQIAETQSESTLITDMLELSQQIQKIKANQTTFGAGSTAPTTQRTGWNLKGK